MGLYEAAFRGLTGSSRSILGEKPGGSQARTGFQAAVSDLVKLNGGRAPCGVLINVEIDGEEGLALGRLMTDAPTTSQRES